jgi:hypothetical protein
LKLKTLRCTCFDREVAIRDSSGSNSPFCRPIGLTVGAQMRLSFFGQN